MVGIDFFITKSKRSIDVITSKHVKFDENIQGYLVNKERNSKRFSLLIDLDQYADKLFSEKEIKELVNICEGILNVYKNENDSMEIRIREFTMEFKKLCLEALEQNLLIIAVGD
ncbi:hypothetical protein [Gottfriedia solisilvae]|uniref:Uncharacterized protein n=1 Tax=Gottfriedia solisilvae TaxID=1516104 RepID=A0A8J3AXH6_9BACI|nr:hypothetical protein [Gottfriedia solisilvae]GGI18063.1 hypothetical protein GCM10007380_41060 [Gottfriedia solisilvae]